MSGFPHGTPNGYRNLGCRCAACRHAGVEYTKYMNGVRAIRLGPCSVEGCERGQYAKGVCHTHRERQLNGRDLTAPIHESSVRPHSLRCRTCQEWLPDSCFQRSRHEAHRRGRHVSCRDCGSQERAAYRQANKVPCEGCGEKLVEGKGRANTATRRGGTRVQLDPNRPHLCRSCARRAVAA